MDTASRLDRVHDHGAQAAEDGGVDDRPFAPDGDERRMHVRAYNHWVSLLKGRPCPPIDELDPGSIADFGPNSVLLDFSSGIDDPGIAFLGRALREECDLASDIARIADVPPRSLLSRLTDHYLQIIANRAPIGFEAEFVGSRGLTMLYRGILMPFSSHGETIDYIYGVINWKEMVDEATQASIAAELDAAVRATPETSDTAIWADGPSAGAEPLPGDAAGQLPAGSLGDRLVLARESAAHVRASDARSRAALYRALSRAHDFAVAAQADTEGYHALVAEAGLTVQVRAPLTPIAKLVFGADHDKTRLTEYAAVLAHARRRAIPVGGLAPFLDGLEGGIKALVAAERSARRPFPPAYTDERIRDALREREPLAAVPLAAGGNEFVVLLARTNPGGTLDVIARVETKAAVDAVVRRAA